MRHRPARTAKSKPTPDPALRTHAERFLRAAKVHPEFLGGEILEVDDHNARLRISLNVEMPLAQRARGISNTGVRRTEDVLVRLDAEYPWSSPTFYLRPDFDRSFPHLQPGPADALPRPCLVEGSQQEFFLNAGLVEAGVFNLVEQLVLWLHRAADGSLIDHEQGWEPIRRDSCDALLSAHADRLRGFVADSGGYLALAMDYAGSEPSADGAPGVFFGRLRNKRVELNLDRSRRLFAPIADKPNVRHSIAAVVWAGTTDGRPLVVDRYLPETISTFGQLRARAAELGCGGYLGQLFSELEGAARDHDRGAGVSVAVVFCVRRPSDVIGTRSRIELVPYLIEIDVTSDGRPLLRNGDDTTVAPAALLDEVGPELLRRVSGAPEFKPVSMLGCGSVGSKLTMHLARAGGRIAAVVDSSIMRPHNLARHTLVDDSSHKAVGLAEDIGQLGSKPAVSKSDIPTALQTEDGRSSLFPRGVGVGINTTASLTVREALAARPIGEIRVPLVEIGLFGRGRGGFLLAEGRSRNPNLADLMAAFYRSVEDDEMRRLMFGDGLGLADVQIGQGCGSLTMPMSDARLSLMTAGMAEEVIRLLADYPANGELIVARSEPDNPSTTWKRTVVEPFTEVAIEGPAGWRIRVSGDVVNRMRQERSEYAEVETGGVLMGVCSERARTVTVVDLLPAPPDSRRSATEFVLGTQGLRASIMRRFRQSGGTIFDVGTWHSHLNDSGPSNRDRQTAAQLASERPPPSVLLIVGPTRFYGVMRRGGD